MRYGRSNNARTCDRRVPFSCSKRSKHSKIKGSKGVQCPEPCTPQHFLQNRFCIYKIPKIRVIANN